MRYYPIIKTILILIPLTTLGYFAYQYINPSGILEFEYNFCSSETPYFSGLSPHGRVLDIEKPTTYNLQPTTCAQRMVIDPVYFDVRLSQSYQSANIEIAADIPQDQQFKIGVGVDPENWNWKFAQPGTNTSNNTKLFDLDLSEAQFRNNRYRFIISTPGLDQSEQEIVFDHIKFRFEKEPLTKENFLSRVSNILNQYE